MRWTHIGNTPACLRSAGKMHMLPPRGTGRQRTETVGLDRETTMAGVDILATAFNGANAAFIADLYARWVANPGSVDASFAELFAALNDEARAVLSDAAGASPW